MDLAKDLIRITVRAFYTTEHVLIVDALAIHGTLNDIDLTFVLGMQGKAVRRLCASLRLDGVISSHTRRENKEGAPPPTLGKDGQPSQFKDRGFNRDWYYLNYHRAIDSVKYRMYRLSKHIESLGAPTKEKKDLLCPRCKSSYTELEVMDNISPMGDFLCHRCQHVLDPAPEDDTGENESMKRLNDQLARIVDLMRQIDSTDVPENDFETALAHSKPVARGEYNPARKVQIVDPVKPSLQSSRGLAVAPEEISVDVIEEGAEGKVDPDRKKADQAKQNSLPEWIAKSTISGDITSVGAKEAAERAARDAHTMGLHLEDDGEEKKVRTDDDGAMDSYWAALKAEQEREAREQAEQDEDEEEDDDDDFEDVQVGDSLAQPTPASALPSINVSTPNTSGQVSSTATDDEGPAAKKSKVEAGDASTSIPEPSQDSKNGESDEDDFEFEDV